MSDDDPVEDVFGTALDDTYEFADHGIRVPNDEVPQLDGARRASKIKWSGSNGSSVGSPSHLAFTRVGLVSNRPGGSKTLRIRSRRPDRLGGSGP